MAALSSSLVAIFVHLIHGFVAGRLVHLFTQFTRLPRAQVMNGTAALPSALQPIEDLINGTHGASLNAVISNITKGANPARIVTTGFGAGGQPGVSPAHPPLQPQLMSRLSRFNALTV